MAPEAHVDALRMSSGILGGTRGTTVPKCVRTFQDKIGDDMITPQSMKSTLGYKEYNNLCNVFRASLSQAHEEEYGKLEQEDQRAWIAQWAMDPAASALNGFNKTEVFIDKGARIEERWVSLKQLVGPNFLNDPEAAQIIVDANELSDRPHK